jgi:hypothetical protein
MLSALGFPKNSMLTFFAASAAWFWETRPPIFTRSLNTLPLEALPWAYRTDHVAFGKGIAV